MTTSAPVPIAIVGMSCRFPSGANDPEKFWTLLATGQSAWSDVPSDRYNWRAFHNPDSESHGTLNHRGGHFLDQDVSAFDANFFEIPPSEAKAMDPQQRIQLETAYEALENAGLPVEQLKGSRTGVYVAIFSRDYDRMAYKDSADFAKYHMTGAGDAIISNRISYTFDLKGPSMTIDTGCSGSLVALHSACQSLRTGETDMTIVGGTNLMLSPDPMISMSQLRVLNTDGKCYAFDSRGAGYGRGEGAATIVLKRLDDALQAGDCIRSIIRHTGVNQDGKTAGIFNPDQQAQENLIREVYLAAHIDPLHVQYVEAHGTGTVAGDTTEVRSIANAFCKSAARNGQLFVGSVKSNIGHLESASGLAGLMKTVLSLEKGLIPPSINLEKLKEALQDEGDYIKIPRSLEPFPVGNGQSRLASVNSFGYGGTNAHVILEGFKSPEGNLPSDVNGKPSFTAPVDISPESQLDKQDLLNGVANGDPPDLRDIEWHAQSKETEFCDPTRSIEMGTTFRPYLMVLSAKSKSSLQKMVEALKAWLVSRLSDRPPILDLAYTLCTRRSHMLWRCSVVAGTYPDLLSSLTQETIEMKKTATKTNLTFVFTGQGAQWYGMGRDLIGSVPSFHQSLAASEAVLQTLGCKWSLITELLREKTSSTLDESAIAQPATTAIQIAIVDLLSSLGIRPTTVLGHSSGEIAAAYAAGALSREAAMGVSYHRGFLADECKSPEGAMLAVGLGEDDILSYIAHLQQGTAVVACINSPSSTTISGDKAAIEELNAVLDVRGVLAKRLKVQVAYHSHHMEKIASQYVQAMEGLHFGTPSTSVGFFSSVTAREKNSDFGPSYWKQNLTSKVRFSEALTQLCLSQQADHVVSADSRTAFIEIGPHCALAGPVKQTFGQIDSSVSKNTYIPSQIRNRSALQTVLTLGGKLFEMGYPISFDHALLMTASSRSPSVVHDLPTYPWDHSITYWHESRLSREHRQRQHPPHELLGVSVPSATSFDPSWRNFLSVHKSPWLRDHVVDGSVIYPGSGYICMAIEAMRQDIVNHKLNSHVLRYVLRDVVFSKATLIPDSSGKAEAQLSLRPTKNLTIKNSTGWSEFKICVLSQDGVWNENCQGSIMVEFMPTAIDSEQYGDDGLETDLRCRTPSLNGPVLETYSSDHLYQTLRSQGNDYGPSFARMADILVGECEALGTVVTPDITTTMTSDSAPAYLVHPATLDAFFHASLPLFSRHCSPGSVMPLSIEEITIPSNVSSKPGSKFSVKTVFEPSGLRSASATVFAYPVDEQKSPCSPIIISRTELCGVGELQKTDDRSLKDRSITYQLVWDSDSDLISPDDIKAPFPSGNQILSDRFPRLPTPDLLDCAAALYIKRFLDRLADQHRNGFSRKVTGIIDSMRQFSTSQTFQQHVENTCPGDVSSIFIEARKSGVEGETLYRIGENLEQLLDGKELHPDIPLEAGLLNRLYADDDSSNCELYLAKYLKQLTFKKSNMNILEIGAGTGRITLPLLKALRTNGGPGFERYNCTDISASFVETARTSLAEWSDRVTFETLDIERDPITQGLEADSYDIVIVCNVLHETQKLDESLANLRRLLKPGGRFVIIELTNLRPSKNFIFGILAEFGKGVDKGVQRSPFLSINMWSEALTRQGFGAELVVKDFEGPANQWSMIVARSSPPSTALLRSVEILCDSVTTTQKSEFTQRLTLALQQKGFETRCTSFSGMEVIPDVIYIILDSSDTPLLACPSSERFAQIRQLVTQAKRIFWVSIRGSQATQMDSRRGLITGFARSARSENEGLTFVTLDLALVSDVAEPNVLEEVTKTFSVSFDPRFKGVVPEMEYMYRHNRLLIPRLVPESKINGLITGAAHDSMEERHLFQDPNRSLRCHVEKPGLLDSIMFVDNNLTSRKLEEDEIEIETRAFGVNFKDVFISLGQMKESTPMAGECAGVVVATGNKSQSRFRVGDRVCAWYATPYASRARVKAACACRIPESIADTSAASIPVIFLTAYYGLIELAHLSKNQTVLIHSAAGGVGQAAIMIAKTIGARILATVGTSAKRVFLKEQFGIPESDVFSSRSRFKNKVLRRTDGEGVDVVLNSLAGEALQDSWDCVAKFGTFVEIGKSDIHRNTHISMRPFEKNVRFASLDLVGLADHRPEIMESLLEKILHMFENKELGVVQPITIMSISDIQSAFRLIQSGKHMGKVVLEVDTNSMVKATSPKPATLCLESHGTYVVAGGLGGLGRRIVRFLAEHQAKHIVVLSRRNVGDLERLALEKDIGGLGARVYLEACDITSLDSLKGVVARYRKTLPPIVGVIQAAMVLQDRILEQMTADDYEKAVLPKVDGTICLNEAFKGPDLQYFVMLSSVASICGPRSQANYAAGNSFQDQFAQDHAQAGSSTHYISLNLGMIDESDIIAHNPDLRESLVRSGFIPLELQELFALLTYAMDGQARRDGLTQIVTGFNRQSIADSRRSELLDTGLFSGLPYIDSATGSGLLTKESQTIEQAITNVASLEDLQETMHTAIAGQISSLLAIDAENVSLDSPISSLGLDSLIAIELKTWITRTFQAAMQTSEILDAPSLRVLAGTITRKSPLVDDGYKNGSSEAVPRGQLDGAKVPALEGPLSSPTSLPSFPLQDLENTLDFYSQSVRPFCSKQEFEDLSIQLQRFQAPGGLGRILQSRLQQRNADPKIDDWLADLYTDHVYLKKRYPINPWGAFFGCHVNGPFPHTQAERAAIIAKSAFDFKRRLEAGQIDQQTLNGQPLCMESLQWLFHSYREPCTGRDIARRTPRNDDVVAMRKGHFFKISLVDKGVDVSLSSLKEIFDAILDRDLSSAPRVSVLSADHRDTWAKIRIKVKEAETANSSLMNMVEAAAFVICLDEASPSTSTERANHCMWGEPGNQWSDKVLQFAVCANGFSAYILEHSVVDASTLVKMAEPILRAIQEYRPENQTGMLMNGTIQHNPKAYSFTSNGEIDREIARVEQQFTASIIKTDFTHTKLTEFGGTFLRRHGCGFNAGVQLVIQLASLRYFGRQHPSWETIGMRAFRNGRVELVQAVLPPVADFCAAMCNPSMLKSQRLELFYAAAKAYTGAVNRISRGRGFSLHMYALQEVLQEGEEIPWLSDGSIYQKTRPAKIMTDASNLYNAVSEASYPMPDPDHVWIHYEVWDNECRLAVKAPVGSTEIFISRLREAAQEVRMLLEN